MNFLFDLYGTLADIHTDEEKSELWEGFAKLLGETDGDRVRAEYRAICRELADAAEHKFVEFDLLCVFERMLAARALPTERAESLARDFRILSREKLTLFPCVKEMLTELRECGAGVYLVSNAQSCFTRAELCELGIAECFDGILISSEAGVKKPHKGIFTHVSELFGISLDGCVYVGNDLHDDVLGAGGAGLGTVYIETEQSGKYPDIGVTPDFEVPTHQAMKELLISLATE